MHQVGHLVGPLRVDVVMAGEPARSRGGNRAKRFLDLGALSVGVVSIGVEDRHEKDRHRETGVDLRGVVVPEATQHGDVPVEREPRRDRAVWTDLEIGERAADPGLGPVLVRRPDVSLDLVQRATCQPRRREDLTA